jgi:hypothetical protein
MQRMRRISLLIRLWRLSKLIGHIALMNEVVDILVKGVQLIDHPDCLDDAFTQCLQHSELQTLVVDYALAYVSSCRANGETGYPLSQALKESVFERIFHKDVPAKDIRAPTLADACDYHRHPENQRRCG